jgi:hypothetical protein
MWWPYLRRVSTRTRCNPSHASRGDRLGPTWPTAPQPCQADTASVSTTRPRAYTPPDTDTCLVSSRRCKGQHVSCHTSV